ncbi:MAG: protein translocase subunit SecF [Rickettsiaceae bacterium]|nr:protein translocase subunit SecF [Rickettsiaceae bacterium]
MRLYPLRIVGDNTKIPFTKISGISFAISTMLTILSIICVLIYGLNFGIDFTGGILIEAKSAEKVDIAAIRKSLGDLQVGEVSIQSLGNENDFFVKAALVEGASDSASFIEKIKAKINSVTNNSTSYQKIDFVGPQVGSQLIYSGAQAVILCFLGIMIYVAIRFEWQFGVGVLIALIHDVILSVGFMSITQLDFSLSSIASLLTIVGYSVNDSVVIYDRIRENLRKYTKKSINEIIDISTNETLSRTTMTVLTTLIANLALIIWVGQELRSFSILVFFGIIAGTYSSIFISAPILKVFGLHNLTKKNL